MITVKELINCLQEMIKKYPESENFPIIYSHDDDGNEYQIVVNRPAICQIEELDEKSYRNLELVGFLEDNLEDIVFENCNAVIIN